ncbi:hypothetical protein MKW98_015317 [Papaver atlanticum]|uniref:S-acyltransferase n=1 Tax=Papaver atlanticum TaxID=357466 RepID=A0AAD4T396_9MAGN|nr:hypothetical protein MKW98_015317 [Papaver atlanticum]
MTNVGFCGPIRGLRDTICGCCSKIIPCLSDPETRSSWGLKASLVILHLLYVGVLFIFDKDLIQKTVNQPWYTAAYLFVLLATLAQYFITAGTSPGYVLDAMRVVNESHAAFRKTSESKQSASSGDGSLTISVEGDKVGRTYSGSFSTPWTKMVMDMYPPGSSVRTWTCSHCNIVQPPRAKHCHDCDKCVLKFDHHCVWLGTCIGQDNHFRFWWYIFEENILCFWTVILYISYLRSDTPRAWWIDAIMILLLATLFLCTIFIFLLLIFHNYLILTNQTTFELVRKRRIPYLRGVPAKVFPFSKGICRNVCDFCCTWGKHNMESVPSLEDLEERARPYTCSDVLCCRCC